MSEKRRDNKGRVLLRGESQRPDGRYVYKYTDDKGRHKYIYSRRLVRTDAAPVGAKPAPALRDMERGIIAAMEEGRIPGVPSITVEELVSKHIRLKTNSVRYGTITYYRYVLSILERDDFGGRRIGLVTRSDAMEWILRLKKMGYSYNTLRSIRNVVSAAFRNALEDELVRRNPFGFRLDSILAKPAGVCTALTEAEEEALLRFIKEDIHYSRYYEVVFILLNTGLRISEFAGLTAGDIDFEYGVIRVNRQLLRSGDMRYRIEPAKTGCGKREVPMTSEVQACFRSLIAGRGVTGEEPVVNGLSGFLCIDRNGNPKVAHHWETVFRNIRVRFNKEHPDMPIRVTPHVCRHTFCTRMAMRGMNPKVLQRIMGHSSISITLSVYTHANSEEIRREMARVYNEMS